MLQRSRNGYDKYDNKEVRNNRASVSIWRIFLGNCCISDVDTKNSNSGNWLTTLGWRVLSWLFYASSYPSLPSIRFFYHSYIGWRRLGPFLAKLCVLSKNLGHFLDWDKSALYVTVLRYHPSKMNHLHFWAIHLSVFPRVYSHKNWAQFMELY